MLTRKQKADNLLNRRKMRSGAVSVDFMIKPKRKYVRKVKAIAAPVVIQKRRFPVNFLVGYSVGCIVNIGVYILLKHFFA